ncbi:MAG: hypothetical protein J7J19_06895 [Thaumarchaeota archaeon]|nr:hypothetical protein [Nitrososphaerota archaeon]RLG07528.1 MAG: hypothetical protein DRN65_03335 [Nitrososphaerota archaeon]
MNKNLLFNIVLGGMITLTVPILGALGETRLDAYVSMFTLEYFIATAILRPRRRIKDILALILLIIFFFIVGVRVAEILLT